MTDKRTDDVVIGDAGDERWQAGAVLFNAPVRSSGRRQRLPPAAPSDGLPSNYVCRLSRPRDVSNPDGQSRGRRLDTSTMVVSTGMLYFPGGSGGGCVSDSLDDWRTITETVRINIGRVSQSGGLDDSGIDRTCTDSRV